MNWSPEKVTMLKYASEIKNFDETEWDRDKCEMDGAFGYYKRFLDNLTDYKGEKVNIETMENLESSMSFAMEVITDYDENFGSGDFEKEIEVLTEVDVYFKELKIRIEEAFFGEKVLKISESIATLIEEVDEDLIPEGE
jgi:hypothetical protein